MMTTIDSEQFKPEQDFVNFGSTFWKTGVLSEFFYVNVMKKLRITAKNVIFASQFEIIYNKVTIINKL